MSSYTFSIRVDADPDEAEKRIREALADQGFGILTEIDVQATLKKKLDVDMAAYRILGACNPPLAHRAIEADGDIGALLPCNVVVRANPEGGTDIVAADPHEMLRLADAEGIGDIATEARERLERAFAAMSG